MWEVVIALLLVLGAFSGLLILLLRQFSTLTVQVSREQAKSLESGIREISLIQSEALAKVVAPVINPPLLPSVQVKDIPEEKPPTWREEADSTDLIDPLTGRMMSWDVPVVPEEQTLGPADLWVNPSQT